MFCTVKGLETLGTGKVLEANGPEWHVQYFDGPTPDGLKDYKVKKERVHRQTLGVNTRIYYYDAASGHWVLGRVQQDVDEHVEIRFANRTDISLPHSDVFVRWKRPIGNPVEYLSRGITETPMYAEARSGFLASYIAQRGATGALSALLSSAIELNPHQLDVIRRVLSDASQRYLLADEVGLGKTIEAGVIVRQAVLDDPAGHRVVLLVPSALVSQWRRELTERFGLAPYLDISVLVFPHARSEELEEALRDATMLVVDEAHHLASPTSPIDHGLYEIVRDAGAGVDRLLLLSATPVLRNEAGFLRILHLLDPIVYDVDDVASFKEKIQHRQTLAETVATLDPQNVLQLEPVLDHLIQILPADKRLASLVHALRIRLVGLPDPNDTALVQALGALRAHLSETYRLNRRILRNRRKNVQWLTPNRNGATVHTYLTRATARVEAFLENWRIEFVAGSQVTPLGTLIQRTPVQEFYWDALSAIATNITAHGPIFGRCKGSALARPSKQGEAFAGERQVLDALELAAEGFAEISAAKVELLCKVLEQAARDSTKAVVFCSETHDADSVFEFIEQTGLRGKVVRHEIEAGDSEPDEKPNWARFHTDAGIIAIVCDRRAEEGLNLQGGRKTIVHFDLPLDPNRIEQRIGRLDRYGTGMPVHSIVLLDQESVLQRCWFTLLDEGLGVFRRSISSLQYLVEEQMQILRRKLVFEGVEAMSSLSGALGGTKGLVEHELRLISQQDALDELAPQPETELDLVADIDDDWHGVRSATESWVTKTLMFEHVPVEGLASQRAVDPPFRFKYLKPEAGRTSTLLPLSGFLADFLGALDYEAKGSSSRQPLSYAHSYHRKTAIKFAVRPLRYGSEFIEAVKSFSDIDDRGRSFAIWRQFHRGLPETAQQMYFCFDFLVEVDLSAAREFFAQSLAANPSVALRAVSRRGDASFPPFTQRVWVDEHCVEPTEEFRRTYLDLPYEKNGIVGGYADTNLRSARLVNLMEKLPELFGNWSERCARACEAARALLINRPFLKERVEVACRRASDDLQTRQAQLRTRIQQLRGKERHVEQGRSDHEDQLGAALLAGMTQPSVIVDLAGMILLARESYASVEKAIEAR